MAEFSLRVSKVTKQYGDFVAVGDLSFDVPTGSIYGILGPNGAGKTTTLRMLNDILKPDTGEIRLLDGLAPGSEAARRIGYLPEERGLYPKMKVSEVLVFLGELRGLTRKEAAKQATRWLERLEISDWQGNKVQDLSKGMQQKVQFAAALIHDPELLILDEPWSGLDPINATVLKDIVLAQKEAGRTILFSTHLMEQAEQICDYVCIIARGRKVACGKLADLKKEASVDDSIRVRFTSSKDEERIQTGTLSDEFLVSASKASEGLILKLKAGKSSAQLLSALVAGDYGIQSFERMEATLHQIFVDRVGAQADMMDAPLSDQEGGGDA